MGAGKHYHDFAHVLGVYRNVEMLLGSYPQANRLILLTAALFHDVERDKPNHGTKGAEHVREILQQIEVFPQDLIESVAQIINSHDKEEKQSIEEEVFYDADKMDAFNELATARSFMMYAEEGFTLEEACNKYSELLDFFFGKLHTETAKKLAESSYRDTKNFARKLTERYLTRVTP